MILFYYILNLEVHVKIVDVISYFAKKSKRTRETKSRTFCLHIICVTIHNSK